jgi:hypothetical protein
MLGKAVRIRHCPATVSAPAFILVEWWQEFSQSHERLALFTTEDGTSAVFGKVAVMARVRRPVLAL